MGRGKRRGLATCYPWAGVGAGVRSGTVVVVGAQAGSRGRSMDRSRRGAEAGVEARAILISLKFTNLLIFNRRLISALKCYKTA